LHDALQEIALIERHLRALGDVASLRRFGEAEAGVSVAGSLGHLLLSTGEARTVDRLSRMPGGTTLVRTYLEPCGVPHLSELGGTEMTVEQNAETTTEGREGAIDEAAVRERAYDLSQSEDAGTPDENWFDGDLVSSGRSVGGREELAFCAVPGAEPLVSGRAVATGWW
jgi:hypothetical protein